MYFLLRRIPKSYKFLTPQKTPSTPVKQTEKHATGWRWIKGKFQSSLHNFFLITELAP